MSLTIENGRYYKKMNPNFRYKNYLYEVFNKNEAERLDDIVSRDIIKGNVLRVERADKIIDVMSTLISEYKGVPCKQEDHYQQWYEVLITAAYLYSLFYDANVNQISLFFPRQYTEDSGKKAGLKSKDLEYIFEAVEACNGFNGPQRCRPSIDTPGEMLTLAIFILDKGNNLYQEMD